VLQMIKLSVSYKVIRPYIQFKIKAREYHIAYSVLYHFDYQRIQFCKF